MRTLLGRSRVDRPAEERLGGGAREREVRAARSLDAAGAGRAGRPLPLGLAEHRRSRPARRPRASRRRSPRACRRAPRCARARRSSARRPARRARSSRRAGRRAPPRRRRRRRRAPRTPRARRRSAPRTASRRRRAGGRGSSARSRSAGVAVDLDPLGPAADVRRDVRADAQPRRAEQRRDHQRGRRLAVRADDVDRRDSARCGSPSAREQRLHPPEPELLGPRRERLEPADGPSDRRRTATVSASRAYAPSASSSRR